VDFGSAKFNSDAIFNFAVFRGDGYFNNVIFDKNLNLDRAKFTKLEMKFESIKNHLEYNENVYLKLVENYKSLGWFTDADNCYYQYRKEKQERTELGWAKLIDIVGWLTCGYGVRPGRTLALSFCIIVFFGLLYWFGNGVVKLEMPDNEMGQVSIKSIPQECRKFMNVIISFISLKWIVDFSRKLKYARPKPISSSTMNATGAFWRNLTTQISPLDAFYYSATVFVSLPNPNWHPNRRWRYAVLIEKILGWLMLALFIATLGKVMIR
jgi:hypothetical protein